jgi:hypothetical protein
MNDIHIIDTTLRDGQLSLWALGMKTGAMLAIAEQMDRCGFESIEFFGFAGYIKYVKEHKENPWDWMGPGARKFRRTRRRRAERVSERATTAGAIDRRAGAAQGLPSNLYPERRPAASHGNKSADSECLSRNRKKKKDITTKNANHTKGIGRRVINPPGIT